MIALVMRRFVLRDVGSGILLGLLPFLTPSAGAAEPPVKIVFDTDMAGDVDDVGALAILHALADTGEAEILAAGISAPNEHVGPCLDAINTWYGRPGIPIGYQRGHRAGDPKGAGDPIVSKYAEAVARAFPHRLAKSSDAPDAAALYRKVLSAQPDGSVVIVSVGFLSNLRDLLDSPADAASSLAGEELVKRKVKRWVCMGGKFPDGRFPDGDGEYNLKIDPVASMRAMNDWPTPVVFSGFEIGQQVLTGKGLAGLPETNPVRAAYLHFNGLTHRQSWDQTAVLYAVRGARDYWTESEPGLALMHAPGRLGYNEWIPTPRKSHRYLIAKMPPADMARIIEELMARAPRGGVISSPPLGQDRQVPHPREDRAGGNE
jgi:inosine-uridine nucleoside N-ribohydrolase